MSNDNLALLATVAYAKITDISNSNIIQRNLTDIELSTEQAKKFTDIYDIIAHKPNTSNGYSGTIVKNKKQMRFLCYIGGQRLIQKLIY